MTVCLRPGKTAKTPQENSCSAGEFGAGLNTAMPHPHLLMLGTEECGLSEPSVKYCLLYILDAVDVVYSSDSAGDPHRVQLSGFSILLHTINQ